ncbi:hypothetical protein [Brevundimonas variabilis]|uniref:Uncharacterized protein n=1 Tax=Brevundimonas variabilis TaxID=74312 RepID=A0A7W9CL29_9CAUL|nr:hypothetical protein [Brevundimonas variabilis]MBB5747408.1 hypothetical protein [Brevundimonas variabilis]
MVKLWQAAEMATRQTLVQAKAGVLLEEIEHLSAHGKVIERYFRLSTLRPNQPRVLTCEDDAEEAFFIEVMASLADPVVSKMIN